MRTFYYCFNFFLFSPQSYQNLLMVLPSVFLFYHIIHIPSMSRHVLFRIISGKCWTVKIQEKCWKYLSGCKVLNITALTVRLGHLKFICPQWKVCVVRCTGWLKISEVSVFAGLDYFVKAAVQYVKNCFCNFISL